MSINLSVYVGPYLSVKKTSRFNWMDWDAVVCDGRGEEVTREMSYDRHSEDPVAQINPAAIVKESTEFARLAKDLISWLDENEIEFHQAWGIVPGHF